MTIYWVDSSSIYKGVIAMHAIIVEVISKCACMHTAALVTWVIDIHAYRLHELTAKVANRMTPTVLLSNTGLDSQQECN